MTRTRDEIELDLPFYVNGTLGPEDKAEVERWLTEDAGLSAEASALATIRESMQAQDVQSPGEFGLARLMRDVGREAAAPAPVRAHQKPWLWQVAAALAVAVALGQALLPGSPRESRFELAGARDLAAPAALTVGFQPDATEAQIRALLLEQGVEIVGGPSALGLYALSVPEGADTQAIVGSLRAAAAIVESVEHADP